MADTSRAEMLAGECRIFTRYLIGLDPPPDVLAAYSRAHEVSDVEAAGASRALNNALLRVARVGPWLTRGADAYAAVFAKGTLLRRKLVLLVAILESRGKSAALVDSADGSSRAGLLFGLAARAGACALLLCCATLLIVPLRVWYGVIDGRRG